MAYRVKTDLQGELGQDSQQNSMNKKITFCSQLNNIRHMNQRKKTRKKTRYKHLPNNSTNCSTTIKQPIQKHP